MSNRIWLLFCLFLSILGYSQDMDVSHTTYTVDQLVRDVLINTPCAEIDNITYKDGNQTAGSLVKASIGYFENHDPAFPMSYGVILSSGDIYNAPGPYVGQSAGTTNWTDDPQLTAYMNGVTGLQQNFHNASVLQFDFVPTTKHMSFNFLFASTEYGGFQCSFSDVFAFFLTDLSTGVVTNLALVPGTTDPVSVVTVRDQAYNAGCSSENENYFGEYYANAPATAPINFNGGTVKMTASSDVIPNNKYHIKLVIQDALDTALDSAVFIEGGSFEIGKPELGEDLVIDGSNALCPGDTFLIKSGLDPKEFTFQWTKDGKDILGENSKDLLITESGLYGLKLGDKGKGGCFIDPEPIKIEYYDEIIIEKNPKDLVKCRYKGGDPYTTFLLDDALEGVTFTPVEATYYESKADAEAGDNQISEYYDLNNTSSIKNIWVRLQRKDAPCFTVLSFTLHLDDCEISIVTPKDLHICNEVGSTFDLTQNTDLVYYGDPNYTVSYHNSEEDADEGINPIPDSELTEYDGEHKEVIWVRVTQKDDPSTPEDESAIYDYASFVLYRDKIPSVNDSVTPLTACVEDMSQLEATFNLGDKDNEVRLSASGLIVEYYLTQADAEEGDISKALPKKDYVSGEKEIYARIYSVSSLCFGITKFELKYVENPSFKGPNEYIACDNSGYYEFNMKAIINEQIGISSGLSYNFYNSYYEAENELVPLPIKNDIYKNVIPKAEVIYLRIENKNGCSTIKAITLRVGDIPKTKAPTDHVLCDTNNTGTATFDLTEKQDEILNGLLLDFYDIHYYSTIETANEGDKNKAIKTPQSYSNLISNYVYVRVEDKKTGCFSIEIIKLVVEKLPIVAEKLNDIVVCDTEDNTGTSEFKLSDKISEITAGNNTLIVTFYETSKYAEDKINEINSNSYINSTPYKQGIFVRIESSNGCYVIRTFNLIVNEYPKYDEENGSELSTCTSSNNGIGTFNLIEFAKQHVINESQFSFDFYETEKNAIDNLFRITDPEAYNNVNIWEQTIWIRIVNKTTKCVGIYEINLKVNKAPLLPAVIDKLELCDNLGNEFDGLAQIDLTQKESEIAQNMGTIPYSIIYYRNKSEASLNTNPIVDPTKYNNSLSEEEVWFRLIDEETGCYSVGSFKFFVHTGIILVKPQDMNACNDPVLGSNKAYFDLTAYNLDLVGGTAVFGATYHYYESESDAKQNINEINFVDAQQYINKSTVQNIWIVVENQFGCRSTVVLTISVFEHPKPNVNPKPLETCELEEGLGIGIFDLTVSISDIIAGDGNLELMFFETKADADDGDPDNAIEDTKTEFESGSGSVFVRVENKVVNIDPACYVVVELPLVVNAWPVIKPLKPLLACLEEVTPYYTFNLHDKDAEILDGRNPDNFIITYYLMEDEAVEGTNPLAYDFINTEPFTQYIWARIEDKRTGCSNYTSLIVQTEIKVEAFDIIPEIYCDEDDGLNDGIAEIDLTEYSNDIIGDQPNANLLKVVYFESMTDYLDNKPITNPTSYQNTDNPQTIIAVVRNIDTDLYCEALVTFEIQVQEIPVRPIIEGGYICVDYVLNKATPFIIDTGYNINEYDFRWFKDDEEIANSNFPYIEVTEEGKYRVETAFKNRIKDCYSSSDEVDVVLIKDLNIRIKNQDSVGMIGSLENDGTVDVIVESPEDNLTMGDSFEFALDEGEYQDSRVFYNVPNGEHILWVRYKDERGFCPQYKSIFVLGYPKYFTPNEDGFNDTWNIPSLKGHPEAVIYIFDRYGKLLQQLSPSGEGWNGTFNGKPMPSTDYWFMVEYQQESIDGITPPRKVEFKGHFSLKR